MPRKGDTVQLLTDTATTESTTACDHAVGDEPWGTWFDRELRTHGATYWYGQFLRAVKARAKIDTTWAEVLDQLDNAPASFHHSAALEMGPIWLEGLGCPNLVDPLDADVLAAFVAIDGIACWACGEPIAEWAGGDALHKGTCTGRWYQ